MTNLILLVFALVFSVLAALNIPPETTPVGAGFMRLRLGWLGLAFYFLAELLARWK